MKIADFHDCLGWLLLTAKLYPSAEIIDGWRSTLCCKGDTNTLKRILYLNWLLLGSVENIASSIWLILFPSNKSFGVYIFGKQVRSCTSALDPPVSDLSARQALGLGFANTAGEPVPYVIPRILCVEAFDAAWAQCLYANLYENCISAFTVLARPNVLLSRSSGAQNMFFPLLLLPNLSLKLLVSFLDLSRRFHASNSAGAFATSFRALAQAAFSRSRKRVRLMPLLNPYLYMEMFGVAHRTGPI